MKKILLLLMVLLVGNRLAIAQNDNIRGKYIIQSQSFIKAGGGSYGDGCRNDIVISVLFSNNERKKILDEDLNGMSRHDYYDFGVRYDSIDAFPNLYPTKMVSAASRNWRRTIGGCGGSGSFNGSVREKGLVFCNNEFINNDAVNWWNHIIKINIYPKLTIVNLQKGVNNILPSKDRIIIKSHFGFKSIDYNWQFSLDGITYEDLPQYKGQSELTIDANDVLGAKYKMEDYFNKLIHFKQVSNCGNESNVVTYKILESAPKIIKVGDPVKTTCYDSADGQFRMYFDRPIAQNEHVNFLIRNLSTDSSTDHDFKDIKALEADNSFNLTGLPIGNYQVIITGKKNGVTTFSQTQVESLEFTIGRYDPVDFTLTKTDVWCYEGTDGEIHLTASKGTGEGYWYKVEGDTIIDWTRFANAKSNQHTIKGLKKGNYKIQVRDSNLCVAKEQAKDPNGDTVLGKEKVLPMVLNAPSKKLTITFSEPYEPRFYGATNGWVVAQIVGGTIKDDNSYDFEWVNSKGQQVGTIKTEFVSGIFYITLADIGSDTYYLTVRDKNYTKAEDKVNCTVVRESIFIPQPDPLKASIAVIKPISCHVSNEFGDETDVNPLDGQRDESQDGHLQIIAEGGRPFTGNENGGYPYKFTWKRLMPDQTWKVYDEKSSKLDLLSDGTYAINIMDKYGIVIGVYQNNELVKETDVVYKFDQPKQLQLSFTGQDATCHGADGKIEALITGGTPPYTYKWSNGETTASIKQLESMPYFVTVNDARGCLVQGSYTVNQPDDVVITEHIKPLLCYNAQDAEIEVFVKGGTLPYSYEWNTKATTSKISNLPWGTYQVKVTDAQGCFFIKTYKIDNPQEILLHLDQQRTLCNDQVLDLDITLKDDPGAVYLWESTTGFTSKLPKVSLASEGVYTATVITSNGCVVKDQVEIKRSYAEIGSEFFISTQAYTDEEVILVNVSRPIGQTSEWIVPKEVEVLKQTKEYLTVRFAKEGKYDIKLLQTQGDCYKEYTKEIIVEKNSGFNTKDNSNQASSVEEFIVTPNPNNGVFEVFVQLSKESPINIRMFNALGQKVLMDKQSPSNRVHRVQYQEKLAGGVYIIVVETPTQTLSKRIVIR